jgi:hypothetical protein
METMTFRELVLFCAEFPDLLVEFDRLNGTNLSTFDKRKPIESMIDQATGRDEESMRKFVDFVYEFIWMRVPRE